MGGSSGGGSGAEVPEITGLLVSSWEQLYNNTSRPIFLYDDSTQVGLRDIFFDAFNATSIIEAPPPGMGSDPYKAFTFNPFFKTALHILHPNSLDPFDDGRLRLYDPATEIDTMRQVVASLESGLFELKAYILNTCGKMLETPSITLNDPAYTVPTNFLTINFTDLSDLITDFRNKYIINSPIDFTNAENSLTNALNGIAASGWLVNHNTQFNDSVTLIDTLMRVFTFVDDLVVSYSNILNDELENKTLVAFKLGARSVNAVNSSTYIIGEAMIRSEKIKRLNELTAQLYNDAQKIRNAAILAMKEHIYNEYKDSKTYELEAIKVKSGAYLNVANGYITTTKGKLDANQIAYTTMITLSDFLYRAETMKADLYNKLDSLKLQFATVKDTIDNNYDDRLFKIGQLHMELHKLFNAYKSLQVEVSRMSYVASKEFSEKQLSVVEQAAKWPLDVTRILGSYLASGYGGVTTQPVEPTQAQSALGGALSGAATGAMIGASYTGPGALYGGIIGAVVGGIAGALMR